MEEKMYTFRYSYDELRVVQQSTDGDYGKVIRQEGTITVKGFCPSSSRVTLEASILEHSQEKGRFTRLNSLELIAIVDIKTFGKGGTHYVKSFIK